LLALLPCTVALAQAPGTAPEASVRAAFLYQFGNYVEWPADVLGPGRQPFLLAVLGGADVRRELEILTRGRALAGHPVQVAEVDAAESLGRPAIVYVGEAAADRLPAVVELARERQMLVVCARAEWLDQGCMVGFALAGGRLRFDVSLDALDAAGLKVSSRLLAVARRVEGRPR